jgi:CelD/BcsL family acetyltransferase involved in cellulose biosynthesis
MWLVHWAEHFAGDNLLVFAMRAPSGELSAVAPFYEYGSTLYLLGNGISDYLGICVEPDAGREAVALLSSCLCGRNLELNQLPSSSPLTALAPTQPAEPCFVLDLAETPSIPARQLEKLRYYKRRAEKCGRIEIKTATSATVETALNDLFLLHQLRWSARDESGVLSDPVVESFHRAAARDFARTGNLRLYTLLLNKRSIGALYGFADSKSAWYYLSGFDPEFQQLSPGTILIGHAIDHSRSESHREFNFLRGAEPYKKAWGAEPRPNVRVLRQESSSD